MTSGKLCLHSENEWHVVGQLAHTAAYSHGSFRGVYIGIMARNWASIFSGQAEKGLDFHNEWLI